MNASTKSEIGNAIPALLMDEKELIDVLRNSLYPGATEGSIKLVINWCRASGKDPMKKPVHIVPMNVKKAGTRDDYEWRDTVMPGINDNRVDAARTGEHVGNEDAVFGPDVTKKLGDVEMTFPEWCEFTVYRMVSGQKCRFPSGKVRWLETYATASRNSVTPNAMWKKRPYGQLEKCAEALALRRAFPEVGSQETADEMAGRTIEVDSMTIDMPTERAPVEQPRPRSAKKDAAPALEHAPSETLEMPAAKEKEKQPVEAKPASESAMRILKVKMENATVTEADIKKKFGFGLDGVTTANFNDIVAWLADPTQ
jgi:phage recombination protein Bet